MTDSPQSGGVGRRGFLFGIFGFFALIAGGIRFSRFGQPGENQGEGPTDLPKPENPPEPGFFALEDRSALFALADIIVPRDGAVPAASEVDLLPSLEAWITSDASRQLTYAAFWPELARATRENATPDTSAAARTADDLRPLPELEAACATWYAEYRAQGDRASSAAKLFEQLRRDVIRTYYSTAAGHAVLGYDGPAMRMNMSSGPT
ncbi:MAG: hypothetical protein AB8G23_20530 [Myxococcota bacterium]